MNAYQAGQKLLCGGYTAYTPTGKSYFVKAGRWYHVPAAGDLVYFYSQSLGRVSHVGCVIDVRVEKDRIMIRTIEGNTSGTAFDRNGGMVAEKRYTVSRNDIGGKNRINGFGRPCYGDYTCAVGHMIAVLKREVGYVEKASNSGLESRTANPGCANWTKYGKWYGMNPAYWCQMFISWCAWKACAEARSMLPAKWIQQDDGTWTYRKTDGAFARNEWQNIGGRWYVFDGSGTMIKGWFRSGEAWYYLGEDGGMLSGQWFSDKGKNYYLTASGTMATDAYIGSEMAVNGKRIYYYVDGSGVWRPEKDTENPPKKSEICA